MTLELNEALPEGASRTLSMIAESGQMACLTGGRSSERTALLRAILGLERLKEGVISLDGTPLTPRSAPTLRKFMAWVPKRLETVGHFPPYEAPTVQQVFLLKNNRSADISNGILTEEMRRTGCQGMSAQLLAVGALLHRPILLCDDPPFVSAAYLRSLARQGSLVVVASTSQTLRTEADLTIEL